MHLGNSIICPVTGIPMLIAAGVCIYWAVKKAKTDFKKENTSLIITLTAFVFALQMINFAIPQTGSSGHIIGCILLAALLGRYCAFLAMCTILLIQCLFFSDGGLLALGCNIFNMAFIACFIVYPLLYKPLAERNKSVLAAVVASVIALQLGSLAVVIEGALSGSISGNTANFLSLMQAIHLPIGIVEGLFTAVVIAFAKKKNLSVIFGVLALILSGGISQLASSKPDGLEWSLLNLSDSFIAQTQGIVYSIAETLQAKTALLSSVNPILANVMGVAIISLLMFTMCKLLSICMVKINE